MLKIFRGRRDLLVIVVGRMVSTFGDAMALIALTLRLQGDGAAPYEVALVLAAGSIPMLLRRLITLVPALVILAVGFDPTRALVLSQVVLSFGIPFAVLPLIKLTSNRELMGGDVNHRVTTILGWAIAVLISLLNVVLIWLTVTG